MGFVALDLLELAEKPTERRGGADRGIGPGPRLWHGLHWIDAVMLGLSFVGLVLVYLRSHLPFRMDIARLASAYWIGTAAEAICVAALFCVIAMPLRETLLPVYRTLRGNKALLLLFASLAVLLISWLGWTIGILLMIDALAVGELMLRRGNGFEAALGDVLVPALYLFGVILMLYSYNHALAGIRYAGTYDAAFARMDEQLLHFNTPAVAQWAQMHLPWWVFKLLQLTYFGLYGRIGATLVLAGLLGSRREAMQYVRTLFIGYVMAVALFAVVPVKGPYSTDPLPLSAHPHARVVYNAQHALTERARRLYAHELDSNTATIGPLDYFVGFPSMHAALPLIAIWALRRWRRLAWCLLLAYCVLLLPSTILLEWHYAMDLIGGICDAVLAISLAGQIEAWIGAPTLARKTETVEGLACEV